MGLSEHIIKYQNVVAIADQILDECEENVCLLSEKLDKLNPLIRNELLLSDLLNAYQVFYYFFREIPNELLMERLTLLPASDLLSGIFIDEIELFEIQFKIENMEPVIVVSDGVQILTSFKGRTAFRDSQVYVTSIL